MKKQLLLLLSAVFTTLSLFGQDDLQWLVFKRMGKEGISNPSQNKYSNSFSNISAYNLDGIRHPDTSSYEYNKNDIFIIYQDGTYYNSRVKNPSYPDPGFFYNSNQSYTSHRFNSNPIQYLYLSNIYEQDEPPHMVSAKPASGQAYDDEFTIPGNAALPAPISANHDVVRNADITLVLDQSQIAAAAINQGLMQNPQTEFEYLLSFNSISPSANLASTIPGAFFQPHPIFTLSSGLDVAIFPTGCGTYSPSTNTFRIRLNCSPFTYVNLRPASILTPYYPGINGNVSHQATFSLHATNGQPFFAMNEDIRSSHDPNFIRIDSIYKDKKSGVQMVFCHLEFQNDNPTAPHSIEVNFKLPNKAEQNCVEIKEWNLGGTTVTGHLDYNPNSGDAKCTFKMAVNGQPINLQKCNSPLDEPQCSGYINFNYLIEKGYPLADPSNEIFVKNPTVEFDGSRMDIMKYEDLIDGYKKEGPYNPFRPIKIINKLKIDCSH